MTKTLIDAIYDHRNIVSKCVTTLDDRADAAAKLGMHDLADTLYAIANDLENSSKEVRDAHSIELNQRAQNAEAASIAMVEGLLTGVIMRKESKQ